MYIIASQLSEGFALYFNKLKSYSVRSSGKTLSMYVFIQ